MGKARGLVKRHRVRRSETEWRELVTRFEASGQSRTAFCAEHNLVPSSFGRWWRRFHGVADQAPAVVSDPVFVELAPERDAGTAWDVELELGAGLVLRLRRPAC